MFRQLYVGVQDEPELVSPPRTRTLRERLLRQEGLCPAYALQEAIANIRKHARAESVAIELRRDPDWLHLDVRDYGVGLPADDGRGRNGLGLHSMQERAHLVGGTCVIERAEDRGTRVLVRLPLRTGA